MEVKEAINLIEKLNKERELYRKKRIIYFRLFIGSLIATIIALILFIVFISLSVALVEYKTYMPLTIVFMCIFLIALLLTFTSFLLSRYVYAIKEKYRSEVLKLMTEKMKSGKDIKEK